MENLSRVFQKQKRKRMYDGTEFNNSIQDWNLLPLIGFRKMLGERSDPPIDIHMK